MGKASPVGCCDMSRQSEAESSLNDPPLRELLMVKDLHRFRCPCCRESLEFDARSKKARALRVDTGDENKLDELMGQQRSEDERLGDAFLDAAKAQGSQADQLDDMFSQAFEEAKKDDDKKPRSPFDLD